MVRPHFNTAYGPCWVRESFFNGQSISSLPGRTTFVIAHRPSTVRRADLILLIEDGHVIERGGHEDLMQARGAYYDMVPRQMETCEQNAEEMLR